jgi:hypothetical protein
MEKNSQNQWDLWRKISKSDSLHCSLLVYIIINHNIRPVRTRPRCIYVYHIAPTYDIIIIYTALTYVKYYVQTVSQTRAYIIGLRETIYAISARRFVFRVSGPGFSFTQISPTANPTARERLSHEERALLRPSTTFPIHSRQNTMCSPFVCLFVYNNNNNNNNNRMYTPHIIHVYSHRHRHTHLRTVNTSFFSFRVRFFSPQLPFPLSSSSCSFKSPHVPFSTPSSYCPHTRINTPRTTTCRQPA